MKKVLFLILMFPTFLFAEGPLYSHKEPEKQLEFDNVYKDLRKKASNSSVLSSTSSIGAYISSVNVTNALTVTSNGAPNTTVTLGINSSSVTALGNGFIVFPATVTIPYQPSFLAYNSAIDSNVTGDGTTITIDFDTEAFDVGSHFSNDAFSARVTGKYLLSTNVNYQDAAIGMDCSITIVTSNRNYISQLQAGGNGELPMTLTVLADMDAGDSAYVSGKCNGGGATTSVWGNGDATHGAGVPTFFSGVLLN